MQLDHYREIMAQYFWFRPVLPLTLFAYFSPFIATESNFRRLYETLQSLNAKS